jgi:hypothetical protein
MGRKRKKRLSQNKIDELARLFAEYLTFKKQKKKDGTFYDLNGAGCYNTDGKKVYCDSGWRKTDKCPFNYNGNKCIKWRKENEQRLQKQQREM